MDKKRERATDYDKLPLILDVVTHSENHGHLTGERL